MSDGTPIRLVKVVRNSGAASRRGAGDLVKSGRVAVNGVPVTEPGFPVPPGAAVTLDGERLNGKPRLWYVMLHKPRGYVCTAADPHAEKKAVDLVQVPDGARLVSAGRLDKESEGMILFSNDGDYLARLMHPRYGICKRYEVTLARPLSPEGERGFVSGVTDHGEFLHALELEKTGERTYLLKLNEGKKREIRRLAACFKAPVERLVRIQIGALKMGALPCGQWRELSPEEVALTLQAEA